MDEFKLHSEKRKKQTDIPLELLQSTLIAYKHCGILPLENAAVK
jgi:hypothetical protein